MAGRIPEISDRRLEQLMRQIKPVARFRRTLFQDGIAVGVAVPPYQHPYGTLHFIKKVHPRKASFTWEPKSSRVARTIEDKPYRVITTYHSFGAPSLFKPSIAEVIAQIPEEELGRVAAFETVYWDMDARRNCTSDGYHVTDTRLYGRRRRRR